MNNPNETEETELAGWRDAWMQLGGKDGLAIELATRARKAALRHRAHQVLSVVTAIGVMLDMAWMVIKTHGSVLAAVFSVAISLALGVILTRLFSDRVGRAGSTLESFVALTRDRIARDLRWLRFRRRAAWIMTGMFVPWFIVASTSRRAIFRTTTLCICLYVCAFLITVVLTLLHNARKERKILAERDELETLIAERTLV